MLAYSHDALGWSQVEIAIATIDGGEPDWDFRVPANVEHGEAFDVMVGAIDIWARMLDSTSDDLLQSSSCFVLLMDWDALVLDRVAVKSFGTTCVPLKINDRKVMQGRHGDSEAWRTFAFGVCDNDNVKRALMERQGGLCPICGERLEKSVAVHHVDYDFECSVSIDGECFDCGRCLSEHPEMAEGCLARLRLVHSVCNRVMERY